MTSENSESFDQPPQPQVAIRLSWELEELRSAINGAKLLTDMLINESWPDIESEKTIATSISSTLALIICRLQHVCRVIRKEMKPKTLLALHNQVDLSEHEVQEVEDLILPI